jgi:hypothetical protein
MSQYNTIGFIGLGVMGEPICRNLVKKSGAELIAFHLEAEPLARLREQGAAIAGSVAEVVGKSDIGDREIYRSDLIVIAGRDQVANLGCAIAHRGISRFRVRAIARPGMTGFE